ncbi:TIGR04222 domain-containing membrane protein [Nonomuraea sp. NPDC052116]|uniref:TIGR04222 domain-containing membrane protein n=1 Tax=Nonomuraea sp. NPDC052116 TaxID=3155665 RepID=UPI0034158F87
MDGVLHTAAIVLLALVVLTAIRTQFALFRARSVAARGSHQLSVYEAAFLAGGPRRVINAALVSLVSQGGVRVSTEGLVTPVKGFRVTKSVPVERALYRHVRSGGGPHTTAELRHQTVRDHAMRRLATPLWRQGFLMSPAVRTRSRRRTSWLAVFAGLAAVVAVVSLILRAPPATIVIAGAAAVVGVLCFFLLRRSMANPVTRAGRAALRQAEVDDLADGSWKGSDDAGVVALRGLTELPDRRLADSLGRDTRARNHRGVRAACCAPGHCGSYGSPAYSYGDPSYEGRFFDFGGLFDGGGGSHGHDGGGGWGGSDGGDGGSDSGGGGGCGGGGGGAGCGGGGSQ